MKNLKTACVFLAALCLGRLALGGGVVIDHTTTDLGKIPPAWILQAKAKLRIAYGHTSHGSQLITGIDAISKVLGAPYDFTISSWEYEPGTFLNDSGIPGASDLGNPDRTTWAHATRELLRRSGGCDRNVVMWSWCGQADTSDPSEINTYLNLMNTLERDFPGVVFVYMTGHLVGSGANGDLNLRNQQIRNFCKTNNKVLFDFADIESYDPGGSVNYMLLNCNDNCDYDDGNWASIWLGAPTNAQTTLGRIATSGHCDECAHSQTLNCALKGQAFWWLVARIAGWDGTPLENGTPRSVRRMVRRVR